MVSLYVFWGYLLYETPATVCVALVVACEAGRVLQKVNLLSNCIRIYPWARSRGWMMVHIC